MATVRVDEHSITIDLGLVEKLCCGGRSTLVVPLGAVRALDLVERPTRVSATGVGHAGVLVTGVLKIGRWGVGTPTHRFVSVRRWVPAVRIVLADGFAEQLGYQELLISTPDAEQIAAARASR